MWIIYPIHFFLKINLIIISIREKYCQDQNIALGTIMQSSKFMWFI